MAASKPAFLAFIAGAVAVVVALFGVSRCMDADDGRPGTGGGSSARSLEFVPTSIGAPVSEFGEPWVSHVAIADLDQDGVMDVLYCDGRKNSVRWIRQAPRGVFTEHVLDADILGPVHVELADLYGSGRRDLLVASMGKIPPSNERTGSVVVLENLDNQRFRKRVLAEGLARVTDVRAANLAGHTDGRLDLIVGQFGYIDGEISWMKNLGDWRFERTVLHARPGAIHTPVADFDGDGVVDFATLIAQHDEEVRLFRHRGGGKFADAVVWRSKNQDWGSSGMSLADVNRDGRPDLVLTNGDGLDFPGSDLRPWHGVQWLENTGGGFFTSHPVGNLPGAYSPGAADLDGDNDIDLVAVSAFADWSKPDAVSLMAWINEGPAGFRPQVLARRPIRLITLAVGDLDGNGVPVIVTGAFFPWPPFEHMSNITLWRRK